MKRTKLGYCLIAAGLASSTVLANLSGNVALSTDYRFRGISQNDSTIAISGGFDYAHEDSGFYAGVWASNVDFQIQTVDDATAEVDIYGGISGEFGDSGIGWDVGFLHFNYPNSDSSLNYNFTEINATISYDIFSLYVATTSDYFAGSGHADYYNISAELPINDDFTFSAAVGHQMVEDNAAWGTPNWWEYKLAISTSAVGADWELAFIDTDLSQEECFGGSDWCDSTLVLSISKSMD